MLEEYVTGNKLFCQVALFCKMFKMENLLKFFSWQPIQRLVHN